MTSSRESAAIRSDRREIGGRSPTRLVGLVPDGGGLVSASGRMDSARRVISYDETCPEHPASMSETENSQPRRPATPTANARKHPEE